MTAYSGAHRDNTPAALTECGRRDQATADHRAICTYPCAHHQPRHSPFTRKSRP